MIGRTISHYRVTEKLGEGGMGVVYKAQDTKLERTVALKFLAAHLLKDEEARKRFHREAKVAAALSHPNICHIYEISEIGGNTFISLEFLEGECLDKRIEQRPLKIVEALEIAQQIANGLEAVHEKHIIHRDIKPSNVIISDKGHVTIMDLGLALLTEGSKLTQLDRTVGTVAYMSPEQVQGKELDHRTDIWALGCVLYNMVCGQQPFKGHYDQALLYEICNEDHEPLTSVRSGVPIELDWIIGKCLAKQVEDRYQQASELALDLRTLAEKLKSGKHNIPNQSTRQRVDVLEALASSRASYSRKQKVVQPAESMGQTLEEPRLRNYWWVVHQTAVVALYGVMVVVLWYIKEGNRGFSTLLPFFGVLSCAIANGTLRIHQLFTARFNRHAIHQEICRTAPWVQRLDWAFTVLLVAAAAAVSVERDLMAGILAAVAVGYLVVFLVVEPATVRAVFPTRNRADR